MNALLGEERVLVDSEAGTTRDAIEVEITHHGRRVMLVDTAGIREAQNDVEARGIGLGRDLAEKCDEQVWLLDAVEPVWPADDWSGLVVVSKIDLLRAMNASSLLTVLFRRVFPSQDGSRQQSAGLEGLLDLLTGGGSLRVRRVYQSFTVDMSIVLSVRYGPFTPLMMRSQITPP